MRICGQLVCGPNERYLTQTLEEFKRLCDDVLVACCNATQKEKDLLDSYGFEWYEDNREWGKFQPTIKTELLEKIHQRGADWILVLDADETVPTLTRPILESLTEGRESCMLYVINLWNDEQHHKKSSAFWNVRFYKSDPSKGTQFLRKPVHCGNAPPYFYSLPARQTHVPHILLHRGLMDRETRLRKVERYRLYDPHATHKGWQYYDMLASDIEGAVYDEAAIVAKITEFVEKL